MSQLDPASQGSHRDPLQQGDHTERVERLARNVATLLTELFDSVKEMAARSESTRKKVFVDLRALLDEIPAADQGILLTRLQYEVQRVFDAQGSPKVGFSSGCVGEQGAGINASDGNLTVGACVMINDSGAIDGGGVQGSYSY